MARYRNLNSGCAIIFGSTVALTGIIFLAAGHNAPPDDKPPAIAVPSSPGGPHKELARLKPADRASSAIAAPPKAETAKKAVEPPSGNPLSWVTGTVTEYAKAGDSIGEKDAQSAVKLWTYGGATVELQAVGRARRFYYLPGQGLPLDKRGVIFDGIREGPLFSGRAFASSEKCQPVPYMVKGSLSPDESSIALSGKKPRLDGKCNITGYTDNELIFSLASKS